ncbi:hypothetical protein DSECCO2_614470 [anaerobic digester metagenome]
MIGGGLQITPVQGHGADATICHSELIRASTEVVPGAGIVYKHLFATSNLIQRNLQGDIYAIGTNAQGPALDICVQVISCAHFLG